MSSVLNKPPLKEIVSTPEVKRITLTDVIKNTTPSQKQTRVASDIIDPITKQATDLKNVILSEKTVPRTLDTSTDFERIQKTNITEEQPKKDIQRIVNMSPNKVIEESQKTTNQIRNPDEDIRPLIQNGTVRDRSSIFESSKANLSRNFDDTDITNVIPKQKELPKNIESTPFPLQKDPTKSAGQIVGQDVGVMSKKLDDVSDKFQNELEQSENVFSYMVEKIKRDIESKQSKQMNLVDQDVSKVSYGDQLPLIPKFDRIKSEPFSDKTLGLQSQHGNFNLVNIQITCPSAYDIVEMDKTAKTLVGEKKFLECFTDDQLNRIGLDRNIPDVVIYPRERKIQMILSDPNRIQYSNLNISLNDMTVGDLLYIAAREKISVHLIPDRYNVRRILVALILYQRKRSDLIQHNLLTDDDLRTIVYVIQSGNEVEYSWILKRCDLEKIIDIGTFPTYTNEFVPRWRRYEILKILPQSFLQSVSFQLASSDLAMVPTDNYIISRLIDLSENPFEAIYAKNRNIDREFLKEKYGMVVPRTWDSMDYIGLNGPFYPLRIPDETFSVEKLLMMGTKDARREYLNRYHDIVLLQEIKNYVPYNGRTDLIENILKVFDSTEEIYFVCLVPKLQGKIYYGNYSRSEIYSQDTLATKLDFLTTQNYPLEDKLEILKKIRQLQTLLINTNMMTPKLASSISRLITTYESNPDAQPFLYYFLLIEAKEIANIRKLYYQRFYYAQTRNCLYSNMIQNNFINKLPKLYNINRGIPTSDEKSIHDSNEALYDTIAYMKLFFGYIPHSIRNFGMS